MNMNRNMNMNMNNEHMTRVVLKWLGYSCLDTAKKNRSFADFGFVDNPFGFQRKFSNFMANLLAFGCEILLCILYKSTVSKVTTFLCHFFLIDSHWNKPIRLSIFYFFYIIEMKKRIPNIPNVHMKPFSDRKAWKTRKCCVCNLIAGMKQDWFLAFCTAIRCVND